MRAATGRRACPPARRRAWGGKKRVIDDAAAIFRSKSLANGSVLAALGGAAGSRPSRVHACGALVLACALGWWPRRNHSRKSGKDRDEGKPNRRHGSCRDPRGGVPLRHQTPPRSTAVDDIPPGVWHRWPPRLPWGDHRNWNGRYSPTRRPTPFLCSGNGAGTRAARRRGWRAVLLDFAAGQQTGGRHRLAAQVRKYSG